MNDGDDLLAVDGLSTEIKTDYGIVHAVDDVSLRVAPGEAVALVGESGCGKSMTAFSIMRLIPAGGRIVAGNVRFRGTNLTSLGDDAMRDVRGGQIGMIFQDPMTFLNPIMRIGDQVAEAIAIHNKVTPDEAWSMTYEALQRVHLPGIDQVINYFPHQLSGGMRQRVLIAIAIGCRPALLIADEPTTALDVTIQAQIMDLLRELRMELRTAMLLITHDLGLVAEYCDRAYVMYAGRIVEEADVVDLFTAPRHPYTKALLRSTLRIDCRVDVFHTIEGQPPNLVTPPSGCRFHPRCSEAFERCHRNAPMLYGANGGRRARCLLYEVAPS